MTALALPTKLSLGSIDFFNLAYVLARTSGLEDMPALRGQDAPFTGLYGRLPINPLYDSKTFDAGVLVLPQNSSGVTTGTNQQQARTNLDALAAIVNASQLLLQTLTRTMPDASTRTALARVVGYTPVDPIGSEELFDVALKLMLPDPFFYGASVVDSARVLTASMSYTIHHPGDALGYKVAFAITGPCSSFQITNLATGAFLSYASPISGGSTVTIDSETFSVSSGLDGSLDHQGAVPLMTLTPGDNLFSVATTGTSGASRLTTTFKPPFI